METIIIYAHPSTKGYNPYILEKVIASLNKRKIKFDLIDLYGIKYDPILHDNEHYTNGKYDISEINKGFQAKIIEAKSLIFIYPVWWSSMPAILKGFIDRVFVSRFGFKYINNIPHGLLKGKKAAVFMTTGGPRWYYFIMGDTAKKQIKKNILGFCGIKARVFQMGNARKFVDTDKPKLEKLIKKGLDWLY